MVKIVHLVIYLIMWGYKFYGQQWFKNVFKALNFITSFFIIVNSKKLCKEYYLWKVNQPTNSDILK